MIVKIEETEHMEGVRAEYFYLEENYPGYTLSSQSLIEEQDGSMWDKMEIKHDGIKKTVFFDISDFFGTEQL